MPRPILASIHIDSMKHNLARAKACAPGSKAWAVVKAHAYGHGLERAMRGFAEADGLALVEFDNAVRLRELGWAKPMLMLEGFFDAADIQTMDRYQLNGAVHCEEQLALLEAARPARQLDVHLKMNTGMNRLGFKPEAFRAAYARLRAIPHVGEITLMTHFANADEAAHACLPIREQIRRFKLGADGLAGPLSLSNSAGIFQMDALDGELVSDWIRPGVMLYGGTPGGKSAEEFGLRPTMTLASEIIGVQQIEAGDYVGYGSRFQAEGRMRIGVVACGYADGYPRHAPVDTPVLVDGVRTRIVGRVSMDMLTVDLTPLPQARVGSRVVLWGEGMPIDEVATAAGTIGYELMCALAPRVPVAEG
ncbi:alanine racemase [Massilia sp. MB5]|uniref:alanine racemase n=1 Tax=unclassified Massilia TaxID=2609279 RepID=UPI00067DC845|nr:MULTISPECIES: alanine racemase [unclassified Massilia]AKU21643.1 alanine racemase [Massilia sp. NR 4-1]UMR28759.1 alanine racemase [Massilia sp. MB5]